MTNTNNSQPLEKTPIVHTTTANIPTITQQHAQAQHQQPWIVSEPQFLPTLPNGALQNIGLPNLPGAPGGLHNGITNSMPSIGLLPNGLSEQMKHMDGSFNKSSSGISNGSSSGSSPEAPDKKPMHSILQKKQQLLDIPSNRASGHGGVNQLGGLYVNGR